MAVVWTGPGPEVLVVIDRHSGDPLTAQLQRELRDAIRAGRLVHGERLPSTRMLAQQLGVSRGVVVDCYAQLESEGYLEPRVGKGTQVAYRSAGDTCSPRPTDGHRARSDIDVDFEYGIPDLGSFPMRDWSWALARATRTATVADLGDELGAGSPILREVLASYVRRVRASSIDPSRLVVCRGFRDGLNVVLGALRRHGCTGVALEDPGPIDHDVIVEHAGLRPVAVAVDEDGIDVDGLATSRAQAVVVTPAHQCPSGVVLSAERRLALIEWARDVDGYVVEDDYDAEFRYDRQPVGSLQGLAPDRVLGMGSVSKTLAPMLRLGWIASPPTLLDSIIDEQQLLSRGAPTLDQLALAALIESGRFDKHLRHMRTVYARRRQALVAALAVHAPGASLSGLAAGGHAVVRLPAGFDEAIVVEECARRSVALYAMSRYRSNGAGEPPELVLGYSNLSEAAIEQGIAVLGDVLRQHS